MRAQGDAAFEEGNLSAAIDLYARAVELNSGDHQSLSNLSEAYLRRGDTLKALKCSRAVADMKPKCRRSYYNIGEALCLLQQFADAKLVFKEGLLYYPDDLALRQSLYDGDDETISPPNDAVACEDEENSNDDGNDTTQEMSRQRIELEPASYLIPARHPFRLIIMRGHIVDFKATNPEKSAIVNCANEVGINDSICEAGGQNLLNDRQNLTLNDFSYGNAYLTGPDLYGKLNVRYVIHAVGPNFRIAAEDSSYLDNVLSSAYTSSLECGKQNNIEAIAFSLLCADNRRGGRTLEDVLRIGIEAIATYEGYPELKEVYMFASTRNKASTLLKLCTEIDLSVDSPEEPMPTTASTNISSDHLVSVGADQSMNEVAEPSSSNVKNISDESPRTDSSGAEGRGELENDQATLDENLDILAALVNRAAARLNLPFIPSDSGADILPCDLHLQNPINPSGLTLDTYFRTRDDRLRTTDSSLLSESNTDNTIISDEFDTIRLKLNAVVECLETKPVQLRSSYVEEIKTDTLLGDGYYGSVCLGIDPILGKQFALKMIKPLVIEQALANSLESIQKSFQNEIKVSLVCVFDTCTVNSVLPTETHFALMTCIDIITVETSQYCTTLWVLFRRVQSTKFMPLV